MLEDCVIKIYLPKCSPEKFLLYGHKKKEEIKSKDVKKTVISYFVINTSADFVVDTNLQLLGTCGFSPLTTDGSCNITKDKKQNIVNVTIKSKEIPQNHRFLIFYYDKTQFLRSYNEIYSQATISNNFSLFIAQSLKDENEKMGRKSFVNQLPNTLHNILIGFSSVVSKVLSVFAPLFKKTVIYRHCCNWQECLTNEHSRNGFILLDILLGIIFCLLLNHLQHSGRYFMELTEYIVSKLRGLLEMLDGSPAGLKLNVQLNNFLLSCFMYHVDLWFNFIVIVEPAIHYLFLPINMFGLMGFSFQCAMLCDVITLITLHAHCFYIYAAMLYKLELSSIRSLLRIVLGRRLNVLKNRVESQLYTNRQLFLATLFFTVLLFLLPTVIIYYLVFATLRLFIYCLSYILMNIQYKILTFPFYKYLCFMTGSYIDPTNISVDFVASREVEKVDLCEFELTLKSCCPWRKSAFAMESNFKLPKPLPIETFAKFLVKGEMMAFLPKV